MRSNLLVNGTTTLRSDLTVQGTIQQGGQTLDSRYVQEAGDTMTGTLVINVESNSGNLCIESTGDVVQIGNSANGRSAGVAVGAQANGTTHGTAVGRGSSGAYYGVGIGDSANALSLGTAVGAFSSAKGGGAALGYYANAATDGAYSYNIAVGRNATAYGGSNRIAIGQSVNNPNSDSAVLRGTLFLDGATGVFYRSTFGAGEWVNLAGAGAGGGISTNDADARYLCKTGDTMTGTLAINVESNGGILSIESASDVVQIGNSANGRSAGVAVGAQANGTTHGTAVGRGSSGAYYGVGIGDSANALSLGTAVGAFSSARGGGAALGYYANASTDGAYSYNIAVGRNATAYGGSNRIAIGQSVNNQNSDSAVLRGTLFLDGATGVFYRSTFGSGEWINLAGTGAGGGISTNDADARYLLMSGSTMTGPLTNTAGFYGDGSGLTNLNVSAGSFGRDGSQLTNLVSGVVKASLYGPKNDNTLRALTATTNHVEFIIDGGMWEITSDLTLSNNVALSFAPGSMFNIHEGRTITINGPINCGIQQIVDGDVGGFDWLCPGRPKCIPVEWLGVRAESSPTTVNGSGFYFPRDPALAADNVRRMNSYMGRTGRRGLQFGGGWYFINDTIFMKNGVMNGNALHGLLGDDSSRTVIAATDDFPENQASHPMIATHLAYDPNFAQRVSNLLLECNDRVYGGIVMNCAMENDGVENVFVDHFMTMGILVLGQNYTLKTLHIVPSKKTENFIGIGLRSPASREVIRDCTIVYPLPTLPTCRTLEDLTNSIATASECYGYTCAATDFSYPCPNTFPSTRGYGIVLSGALGGSVAIEDYHTEGLDCGILNISQCSLTVKNFTDSSSFCGVFQDRPPRNPECMPGGLTILGLCSYYHPFVPAITPTYALVDRISGYQRVKSQVWPINNYCGQSETVNFYTSDLRSLGYFDGFSAELLTLEVSSNLHVAGTLERGNVKSFDLTREIGPNVGDFVTLGQIANTVGNYAKIHITGDFMCGMVNGDFILNRLIYSDNTSSWIELPMLPGVTHDGKDVVVDARCTSPLAGYTEFRVRRKGAGCAGVSSFSVSIETDGEYVEQNTTGTGAEVASGYLAFDSWQFPVAASSRFQATTDGLFVQPNGSVGIGTTNPAAKLDVAGSVRVNGGTEFNRMQAGTHLVGSNSVGFCVVTAAFPTAFSGAPKITCTPRQSTGESRDEAFMSTVRSVSTTNFIVNIKRGDASGGWLSNLQLDWFAWE